MATDNIDEMTIELEVEDDLEENKEEKEC